MITYDYLGYLDDLELLRNPCLELIRNWEGEGVLGIT